MITKVAVKLFLRSLWYWGWRYVCPCCNGHFRTMAAANKGKRKNACCPRCGSVERHRLIWLFFQMKTQFFKKTQTLIHFAPEYAFESKFYKLKNLQYIRADIASENVDIFLDITALPFKDRSVDCIICIHVLEHIVDDHRAMSELARILKMDGWALLQTPVDEAREYTDEDTQIVSPEERQGKYGHREHVRIYGQDYYQRLSESGFQVHVDNFYHSLSSRQVEKYRLDEEKICWCTLRNSDP